jgi:quercetin dioxygenase-like cupin family protein
VLTAQGHAEAEPEQMPITLKLTPSESVTIRQRTPDVLEVEAVYAPHGQRPPKHLHPFQDEHFEVLEGEVMVKTPRFERKLTAGEAIDIPRRTSHQMWNAATTQARVRWETRPPGRTQEWFEAIDALHRSGRVGSNGMPGPLAFGTMLTRYRDVFRLAGVPDQLTRPVLAVLGVVGRRRGY